MTTETEQAPRTFWPADYARFAAALRRTRHVQCQPWAAKDDSHQQKINLLVGELADLFAADAPEQFDTEKFLAGTELPGLASAEAGDAASGGDDDEEPGEDEGEEPGGLLA